MVTSETTDCRVPRKLAGDAARFIKENYANISFPDARDVTSLKGFLDRERARLSEPPTREGLAAEEAAVITVDRTLGDGCEVRIYIPVTGSENKPKVLYIHGGGWVSGSINQHDATCRVISSVSDVVVINVGYRLAPEHRYPEPLDDCIRVFKWANGEAKQEFSLSDVTAVVGGSSGGNLAAALTLWSSAHYPDSIALQVLLYPALDSKMSGESYRPEVNGSQYFVTAEQMRWYWEQYAPITGLKHDDPYFSPAATKDLSGLPPTIVVTAEFDALRDDGIHWVDRLIEAKVPVLHQHYPGQIHGFLGLRTLISEAVPALNALSETIGKMLISSTTAGGAEFKEFWWG